VVQEEYGKWLFAISQLLSILLCDSKVSNTQNTAVQLKFKK
jgi:hypothetical protein